MHRWIRSHISERSLLHVGHAHLSWAHATSWNRCSHHGRCYASGIGWMAVVEWWCVAHAVYKKESALNKKRGEGEREIERKNDDANKARSLGVPLFFPSATQGLIQLAAHHHFFLLVLDGSHMPHRLDRT